MIELGPLFTGSWRGYPPNFSPNDYAIWQVWIQKRSQDFNGFYYNVKLIDSGLVPLEIDPAMKKMWQHVNAKKIDAIGIKGGLWTILEFRQDAGLSVIGQLLGYWALILQEDLPIDELRVLLITNAIDEATKKALWVANIPIEVVNIF